MKTNESAEVVRDIAISKERKEEARFKSTFFTRNRKMPFTELLYFLLNPAKECLQIKLNRFFKATGKSVMRMSQQALSAARSYFDHSPFEKMARKHVELEYSGKYHLPVWNGYHVFAIDGSTAMLPNSPELKREFGVSRNASGVTQACAGISVLCDVMHGWITDASITQYPQNERDSAKAHIQFLEREMVHLDRKIVLFDRGYASHNILEYLEEKKINYLMRCQKNSFAAAESAPMGDSSAILKNGLKVRVYKFVVSSGEVETLITDLFDLPESELPGLYFLRWGVEGKYDVLKNKLELENFSGYTRNSVLQDFWVSITLSIIVAIAKQEADEKIQQRTAGKNNKHRQNPNVSQLVGSLKDEFVLACRLPTDSMRIAAIERVINEISLAVSHARPDRPPHSRSSSLKKKQSRLRR